MFLPVLVLAILAVGAASAQASVGWTVHAVPIPSSFAASDALACSEPVNKCDRYQLLLQNSGDEASKGPVTITDTLPKGITFTESYSGFLANPREEDEGEWECEPGAGGASVKCTYAPALGAGLYTPYLQINVSAPTAAMEAAKAPLVNTVTVEGGGAAPATVVGESALDKPAAFELREFNFEPQLAGGAPAVAAGGHPWQVTTSFQIPSQQTPPGANTAFEPPREIKSVVAELPAGFVGDPLVTERCTEIELREDHCPAASAVGVFAFQSDANGGSNEGGFFEPTGELKSFNGTCCTKVFNMVPEAGYPAEFGFAYGVTIPIVLYANLVHTGSGYRVRVTVPASPVEKELAGSTVTFFGEPGAHVFHESEPVTSASEKAFLSSPSDCSAEAEGLSGGVPVLSDGLPVTAKDFSSRLELGPWSEPGPEHVINREDAAYPSVSGCKSLEFAPKFSFAPSAASEEGTTQADTPSAYTANLEVPQTTGFAESSTPDVRNTVVTLPAGTSVSPSAANGLVGCQATGPEGINIGSSDIGPGGQDLGDPEATELGAGSGREGGNGSIYDDGLYHTAVGHCPSASKVASVEVTTPVLEEVLPGSVYVAQPACSPCSEAQVEKGEVFALYLEINGEKSGTHVKLAGKVEIGGEGKEGGHHNNLAPGQVRTSFPETPQLPFSDLKLQFHGGPRGTLANSQSCGTFTTGSEIESWAHREADGTVGTPNATPSSSFAIGGCESKFAPSFTAGTSNTQAGAYSPFSLTFGRHDGEQDLAGLTVNMPVGLVGKIAGIPLCGEAEANAGTCAAASRVGTATAAAGAGADPYYQSGGVYLTGPYNGGPFGLSVVVPAKAGPYNLGNVITRASIRINPATAAVTVVSNPLPQSVEGVPLRLQSVNVTVGEAGGFTLNPTNCAAAAVGATVGSAQGAAAAVASPFQATGCPSLKFAPQFTASTQGNGTTKGNGASLDVKIAAKQGPGEPAGTEEANIAKVDTSLPLALSSRLTTLHKACTEQQFALDPANCPAGADVGYAIVHTPLLNAPLMGPAILVSHGGRAFPDLDIVLQGEGVVLDLVGNTDIKKGITYTKFEAPPDAAFSSFELNLPEKEASILAAVKNLCAPTKTVATTKKVTKKVKGKKKKVTVKTTKSVAESLVMPTEITGQNGAFLKQNTKIAVTGCRAVKSTHKATTKKRKARRNSKK